MALKANIFGPLTEGRKSSADGSIGTMVKSGAKKVKELDTSEEPFERETEERESEVDTDWVWVFGWYIWLVMIGASFFSGTVGEYVRTTAQSPLTIGVSSTMALAA